MPPAKAKPFYASLVEKFQRSYSADSVKGKTFICHPELLVNKCFFLLHIDMPILGFAFHGPEHSFIMDAHSRLLCYVNNLVFSLVMFSGCSAKLFSSALLVYCHEYATYQALG